MDEQTARTKWCPMTRYEASNRFPVTEDDARSRLFPDYAMKNLAAFCAGSDCMLWIVDVPEGVVYRHIAGAPANTEAEQIVVPAQGHCGLGR